MTPAQVLYMELKTFHIHHSWLLFNFVMVGVSPKGESCDNVDRLFYGNYHLGHSDMSLHTSRRLAQLMPVIKFDVNPNMGKEAT
jgi:hypothetical protein